MSKDRFKDFDDEEIKIILDFEKTVLKGRDQFFDVDELEIIIDYYLEVSDLIPLERAVEYAEHLYPNSTEIRLRRAHLLIVKQHYHSALRIIQELRQEEPDNTDIAYSLGVVYSAMKQSEKAITYFLEAAKDGWQLGRIYANIAEEYFTLHDYDNAIRYYQLALDTDSYDESTLYNYVDTAFECNMVEETATYIRSFLDEHPYSAEGWHCLGNCYYYLTLYEKAIDSYDFALAIDKSLLMAYTDKACAQEEMGRTGEAVTTLIQQAEIVDNPAPIYSSIAYIYDRHNNHATALAYFQKALDLSPDDPNIMSALALCLLHSNDTQQALATIKRALKQETPNALVFNVAAKIYDQIGNIDMARDYYERMLDTDGCSEDMCQQYIDFLYRNQFYNEVIDFAQESLNILPKDGFYSAYLVAAYYHTNRYNSARQHLDNADLPLLSILCPEMPGNPLFSTLFPSTADPQQHK